MNGKALIHCVLALTRRRTEEDYSTKFFIAVLQNNAGMQT